MQLDIVFQDHLALLLLSVFSYCGGFFSILMAALEFRKYLRIKSVLPGISSKEKALFSIEVFVTYAVLCPVLVALPSFVATGFQTIGFDEIQNLERLLR